MMNQEELLQIIEQAVKNKDITLNLSRQNLIELPLEIGQLVNLQVLDLSDNRLTTLPPEIGQLVNLQELNLSGNQLTTLPAEIAQLINLQRLDLIGNQLKDLPAEIGQPAHLQYLYLTGNQLTTLPSEIARLVNLEVLNLDYNQLTTLPPAIFQLIKLQWLILDNNQLTALPAEIGQLFNLQRLSLIGNQLTVLPLEIGQLSHLLQLNLNNNQLAALPQTIAQLVGNLQELWLYNNQLSIPPEILEHGNPTKIIHYYLQLQKNPKPLNEAKMLIVGEGKVGKTSLVNRLTRDIYNDAENRTEGIQINQWPLEVEDKNMRLNIWDFGGQEIMHATHQFFLTKRSLYILVLDARQGERESRVEYWLKIIQSFGGDSPIIIAINKSDECQLNINKRGLKAKYPTLKEFFDISCKTGEGIPELIKDIEGRVGKLEHVHDPFPGDWLTIKLLLENMTQDFISYDKYLEMCQQQQILNELSQEILIGFLHDLGIVLNYRKDELRPTLRDTNILNPEWVTQGVYKLLNSYELFHSKGILSVEQLSTLLDPQRYPPDRQILIVEMMEKFELWFEIKDAHRQQFLIPELLSKDELDVGWDEAKKSNSLAFQYHYDILPTSIMSRFIVRVRQLISKNTYWHSGVVLVRGDNKALITSDTEDKKIFIWISGEPTTRREFLTVIRKQFQYLHQSIPKINAIEQVPYKTIIIPYQDLCNVEDMGKESYLIASLKEEVPISQLLDGIEKIESARGGISTPVSIEEPALPSPRVKKINWDIVYKIAVLAVAIVAAIAAVVPLF